MQPIPGSAIDPTQSQAHLETSFGATPTGPRYYEQRRWEKYGGEQAPMTKHRTRALAKKRRGVVVLKDGTCIGGGVDGYASKNHAKPASWFKECASGKDLLAGFATGQLFLFPLENRRGKEYVPTCIPTEAKWKMRPPHVRIVQTIATAMIGMKKRGLVISYPELVKLATSSGRAIIGGCERSIGTYVRQLRAWGLISTTPIFRPYGCVTNERASCYHLTTLAAGVWRLRVPAECGALPDPEIEIALPVTAKSASSPEKQSLPANPETPLRGRSPEEHEACPPDYRGVGEAADTAPRACAVRCVQGADSRASAATFSGDRLSPPPADANESLSPAQPVALPEMRDPVGRRVAPGFVPAPEAEAPEQKSEPQVLPSSGENAAELELAQRRAGDAVGDVRRDRVDERYVEGDRRETEHRLRLAKARAVAEEKSDLQRRQAVQLELVRRREAEKERDRAGGGRGAVLDDDAPMNGRVDADVLDMLRRERESLRDEQNEQRRYNLQGPTKTDPDADFCDVIERVWKTKFGEVPVVAQVRLDKMRGGKL